MGGLSVPMLYLWAFSALVQFTVLGLLFSRNHFRTLKLFTAYLCFDFLAGCCMWFVYRHFGYRSLTTFWIYWPTEAFTLLLQAFALFELFHLALDRFSGIWNLAWRLLLGSFLGVLIYAGVQARLDLRWAIMIAQRGFYLAFVVAIVSFLLLARYYAIAISPLHKIILGGFGFYYCVEVFSATLYQVLSRLKLPYHDEVWAWTLVAANVFVQVLWVVALRKPVQVATARFELLPASTYQQISPEINMRLRLLNDRLSNFWKVGQSNI
ncbi:MAG: hypothetical protein NVS9B4_17380 [Candidatus Acidiferrum sp.]